MKVHIQKVLATFLSAMTLLINRPIGRDPIWRLGWLILLKLLWCPRRPSHIGWKSAHTGLDPYTFNIHNKRISELKYRVVLVTNYTISSCTLCPASGVSVSACAWGCGYVCIRMFCESLISGLGLQKGQRAQNPLSPCLCHHACWPSSEKDLTTTCEWNKLSLTLQYLIMQLSERPFRNSF